MRKYRVKEYKGEFTVQFLAEIDDIKTMVFGKKLRRFLFGEHVPKFEWVELDYAFKSLDDAKQFLEKIKENTRLASIPPVYHEID